MKAIIFDFDGTLANTLPVCFRAFQSVFKKYDDRELSSEEIKAMFGPSETGIIRENLRNKNSEQAIELYYEQYVDNHVELVAHNEQIDGMLQHLKNNGIKLGIVTGKARRSLDISLDVLNMKDVFEVIITGDDVEKPKPHPEGVLKALSLLGVNNNEAMFIGDSDADIEAGRLAEVYTVGVQWLPDYHTEEFKVVPDTTFASVNEFVDFLDFRVIENK